jgi:hypothetical protein
VAYEGCKETSVDQRDNAGHNAAVYVAGYHIVHAAEPHAE